MNITDLSSLKQIAILWAAREGESSIEDNIDNIVQSAEARINRLIRIEDMLIETTYELDPTDEETPLSSILLPNDFGSVYHIKEDNYALQWRVPDELIRLGEAPNIERGRFYTVIGHTLRFVPAVSKTITVLYYRLPPFLHTLPVDAQTHLLLQKHPDLYLYATLAEFIIFDRSYEEGAIWDSKFNQVVAEIKAENDLKKLPLDQPIISSVALRGRQDRYG